MAITVTSKHTKAQILKSYNDLSNQLDKALKDMASLKSGAQQTVLPSTKTQIAKTSSTKAMTIIEIIESLKGIKTRIGESASILQQKLTFEATQLQDVNDELKNNKDLIKTLHSIEISESTYEELMEKYKTTSEQLENQYSDTRKKLAEEMKEKKEEWKKEQQKHQEADREKDRELKKLRQRNTKEYDYELDQTVKLDDDSHKQQKKEFKRDLGELKEAKEREWDEREKALAKREIEAYKLREKAEALPEELEKAVRKAEEEGASIARRQAKTQSSLLQKEFEGKRRVYELRIGSLEETINKQSAQIDSLTEKLSIATKQAQDLAVKALEGAAGATSFEAIKEIALEQAKNVQKGK